MSELPDFDLLWDYSKPAEMEAKFRDLVPRYQASGDKNRSLELQTQIARSLGLQKRFDDAHRLLNDLEKQLSPEGSTARVRYLLERGRVLRSSKQTERARPFFEDAWTLARQLGLNAYAIDAAHMVALVESDAVKSLDWNLKALDLAERSPEERARGWRGSLYNNIGWTYHDQGDYERALQVFEKALAFRLESGNQENIRVARWCIARTLRSLGRVPEALSIQQRLLDELIHSGKKDGYVYEEVGECLLLLDRSEEAGPYFSSAYEELSKDLWLPQSDPKRMERLRSLGTSSNS